MQRILETAIQGLKASSPRISLHYSHRYFEMSHVDIVLLCQTLAMTVWLGLYYLNNVRLYLQTSSDLRFRRVLCHTILTTAFVQFYLLAATLGHPSTNQLLIILSIVFIDTFFPLSLGDTLEQRLRAVWMLRGVLQSLFVLAILVLVPPRDYPNLVWSLAWLLLMLVQLLVLAPLDNRRQRQRSP
jgi:hypothetical protein